MHRAYVAPAPSAMQPRNARAFGATLSWLWRVNGEVVKWKVATFPRESESQSCCCSRPGRLRRDSKTDQPRHDHSRCCHGGPGRRRRSRYATHPVPSPGHCRACPTVRKDWASFFRLDVPSLEFSRYHAYPNPTLLSDRTSYPRFISMSAIYQSPYGLL